ncbi:ATP-binding protein [Actinophytocola sp.]|uniref:ATP-binding protein n=1 Tax=Actinophytocola sp. TaxID=1872138 RepID=UPI002D2EB12C|nr:AAA family ATPase [Actinophytocola sp.]HYQ63603.1 AAA family ATPase [Actinophytocola sp.]
MRNRSSIVVGRDRELLTVKDALTEAAAGQGGAVFLIGESGIGKSRLATVAADHAFETDMVLMRGRGSAIGPMVPFRSLTEALLSLLRAGVDIDVDALGPYRPVLARLIPDWGTPTPEQDGSSLVILAEAVLRLTRLAGTARGCLVSLDDLQDADAESLAVVEYLIDNLDSQPTLLLGAIRDEPCPALDLARSAARRGAAVLIELERLDRDGLRGLAAACLSGDVPEPAVDLLWAGSAGNPFLIEELLGGIVDGGLLVPGEDSWRMADPPPADVPATFARTVARRVAALGPATQRLLSVAAVAGRRFPLAVVQAVTGQPDRELLSHLHGEPGAQLVHPDEHEPDWYTFQHQLIHKAMLTLLAPAERARLAGEVADVVERLHPGLPGEWCHTAATLRRDAGTPLLAGRLFTEAGRRALAQGAAHSAVGLLDTAWDLMAGGDPSERAEALEHMVYALAEAGLVERAVASVGTLDQVGGLDPTRRARLHTHLAWAAQVAGPGPNSLEQITAARTLLGPGADDADAAQAAVVEAHIVLDVPGPRQIDKAMELARRAADIATRLPLPVVACQAWQLLGALHRTRDPLEATACLERARTIAVAHGLPLWEIHALVRLGNDDALRDSRLDRLEQARTQARLVGAVVAQYQAEQSIALYTTLEGDYATAEKLVDQVLTEAERLKLKGCVHYVLLVRAILAGHRGRRKDMDEALATFRRWEGDTQPLHVPRIYGLARAFCALLEENRARAIAEQATALQADDDTPTVYYLTGRYGLSLLLAALDDTITRAEFDAVVSSPAAGLRWDRMFALFGQAVLAGRAGDADGAARAVDDAMTAGAPYAMGRHLGLRLVAEAALPGGWGKPIDWLRESEDFFHSSNIPAVASACRALLRNSGVRVAQRRTGVAEIPAALRSAGLTVREYEVLLLLADRLGNREIADRLHLSTRTVEKHVSSLITKTGLPNRIALSEYAVTTAKRG